MSLRAFVIVTLSLACIVTASAALWFFVLRGQEVLATAADMPVPWVKSPGNSGPTDQWSLSQLRTCAAAATETPEHRAQAICFLAQKNDWESVETLIVQLDAASPLVRGRAASAIRHILGTDFHYRAADERPKRLASIQGIRRYWDARKTNPPIVD